MTPDDHGQAPSSTDLREDIEGLRAVAVLSIILFHFGFQGFDGGFVGVDIFYVISGFLIGRSVIDAALDGRFSMRAFLMRRLRRLYPAQIVMLAISTPIAMLLLLPGDLVAYGKSLVATAAYVSNMQFFRESGYFDADAITKPLLHSWSLGIEAQFYVAFPLLIIALLRCRAKRMTMAWTLVGLGALSLVAAEYSLGINPNAAFYLFPLRAWELLAGVVIGIIHMPRALSTKRWLREATAVAGLALTIGPILFYGPKTSFPGIYAVPVVLGTALVILAGRGGLSLTRTILSLPPFTKTGLISYSLYLWHWPIVVYLTYYGAGDLPDPWRIAGLIGTVAVAMLSYHVVERPLRGPRGTDRQTLCWALGAFILCAAAGGGLYLSHGLPGRYSDAQRLLAGAASDYWQRRGQCFGSDNSAFPGLEYCRIGAADKAPDFLVWGDSHARVFRDGLDLAASEAGRSGIVIAETGCPPLVGVRKRSTAQSPAEDRACFAHVERLVRQLGHDRALRDVMLIGRWTIYATGHGVGSDADNEVRLFRADGRGGAAAQLFAAGLRRSVDMLRAQGRRVFIVEQVPEIPYFSAYRLAARVAVRGESLDGALRAIGMIDRAAVEQRQAVPQGVLAALAAEGKITIIPTHASLCTRADCFAWRNGQVFLFDNQHVTVSGSYHLRDIFRSFFQSSPAIGSAR